MQWAWGCFEFFVLYYLIFGTQFACSLPRHHNTQCLLGKSEDSFCVIPKAFLGYDEAKHDLIKVNFA